jgi:hypothetical protein
MAGKVRAFLDAMKEAGLDTAARDRELNRLDTFSAAQLVVADRDGRIAPAVRAMVWVTLVVAPVLLLLFFQLRFLPFHSEWITWWHRGLLAVDLALIWALWPPLAPCRPGRSHRQRGLPRRQRPVGVRAGPPPRDRRRARRYLRQHRPALTVNQTFPLKDAAEAHRALEGRKTTGSTVLLPG